MNDQTPISITDTHNVEAEQGLLGALMINNEAYQRVDDILEPEHFFEPIHQQIYNVISMLIRMGKVANPIMLKPFIPADVMIGDMTGFQYLIRLCAEATTIINARDYAEMIRDFADRRAIRSILAQSVPRAYDSPAERAGEVIDQLSALIGQREQPQNQAVDMRQAVVRAVDAAANAYKHDGGVIGLSFGLRDLDAKLGGAKDTDLIVIGGRPSMGKSALAVAMAKNFAAPRAHGGLGAGGIIFNLEMNDVQVVHRMIADHLYESQYRVAYSQLQRGSFEESKFLGIRDAAMELESWPIWIEQQAGLSVAQIASRARQRKRKQDVRWIIVDYLQLVQASDRYAGNRVNEVSEITQGLKALAKELGVPVIALSQLGRSVDAREDKRPLMADLRDSGSIEQDADVVMFAYRESYYLQNREPKPGTEEHVKWQTAMDQAWNRFDAIIGKNRMGPIGTVQLFCDIGFNAFRDMTSGGYLPNSDQVLL